MGILQKSNTKVILKLIFFKTDIPTVVVVIFES